MHSPTSLYISVHLHVSRHISQAGLPRGEGNWLQLAQRIAQACGGQMRLCARLISLYLRASPCISPYLPGVRRPDAPLR